MGPNLWTAQLSFIPGHATLVILSLAADLRCYWEQNLARCILIIWNCGSNLCRTDTFFWQIMQKKFPEEAQGNDSSSRAHLICHPSCGRRKKGMHINYKTTQFKNVYGTNSHISPFLEPPQQLRTTWGTYRHHAYKSQFWPRLLWLRSILLRTVCRTVRHYGE
jgi:hypothetical protein